MEYGRDEASLLTMGIMGGYFLLAGIAWAPVLKMYLDRSDRCYESNACDFWLPDECIGDLETMTRTGCSAACATRN